MEALKAINIMWNITQGIGLKESKTIHKIIKNIERGVYKDEYLSDIASEIFEGLMDIESLAENTKNRIEKATGIKRVSGYKYFSPIINSLKEFGGYAKASVIVERVIETISENEKIEEVKNDSTLKNRIRRAKKHLSEYGYLYSKPRGVWNLTGKEWKNTIFSSENHAVSKDKFEAKYITDKEVLNRIKQSDNTAKTAHVTTKVFLRNEYVSQFAKRRAGGVCQLCEKPAPFENKEGKPYLETHHITWLSKGGDDSVKNVVALCPNCHTKMHILNNETDIEKLKSKVVEKF